MKHRFRLFQSDWIRVSCLPNRFQIDSYTSSIRIPRKSGQSIEWLNLEYASNLKLWANLPKTALRMITYIDWSLTTIDHIQRLPVIVTSKSPPTIGILPVSTPQSPRSQNWTERIRSQPTNWKTDSSHHHPTYVTIFANKVQSLDTSAPDAKTPKTEPPNHKNPDPQISEHG